MRISKPFLYASVAGVLAGLMVVGANAQTAATLSGQVSSAEEGAIEGVLVSAKKEGSTITTTVVTNDKGQFSFPADRIEPGHYNITIRAAGYNLVGPREVDVAGGAAASADLKLAKAKNVHAQLSNAEWLASAPGNDQIKSFLPDCVGCHTLQRVFSAIHTPDEWKQVFARMGRYAPESVPTRPQLLLAGGPRSERPRVPANLMDAAAEFLVNANVSNPDSEGFNFKRLPRPKGRSTHVIVTEYDLPRKEALPHDVIVDADGHAWYSDFGNQFVGELDPKTGKVQDYALETLRQDQPKGPLGLEFDPEGNIWVGMSYQAGASKIDRKTKQVTTYPLPKEWQGITSQTNMVTPTHMHVDGKVWMEDTENGRVFRLDLASGKWEDRGVATTAKGETIRGYGMPSDKDNNLYLMSFGDTRIGKLDAKTNVAQIWSTAFARSRPRRGRFDDQNRLWFAEYGANRIAMFDPTTEQIKEWKLPTAWSQPYDVVPTKGAAEVWTGSMLSDQVARLNPKTDEIVEYLLPHTTNIRRVFVQETGPRPVLWVGSNHGSAIVKVEPLD
jgi:virginiamycin B lyase